MTVGLDKFKGVITTPAIGIRSPRGKQHQAWLAIGWVTNEIQADQACRHCWGRQIGYKESADCQPLTDRPCSSLVYEAAQQDSWLSYTYYRKCVM